MFRELLVATILFTVVFANNEDELFKRFSQFTHQFKKVYSSEEDFKARFEIFKKNFINNAFSERSAKGVTEDFDLTEEEVVSLKAKVNKCRHPNQLPPYDPTRTLPETLDWRQKGGVSPVKNQSTYDTSFAFCSVAFLESQSLIRLQKTNSYSERQILECDTDPSRLMEAAFDYVQQYGIEGEKEYGYGMTKSNEQCRYDKTKVINYVKNVKCLENPSIMQIKQYLNDVGPLAIGVSSKDFQYYFGGVLSCTVSTEMDLGVLLVGYGTDYWIIKNSWGPNWGESGFAKISNVEGKNCGIGQYVVFADFV